MMRDVVNIYITWYEKAGKSGRWGATERNGETNIVLKISKWNLLRKASKLMCVSKVSLRIT
jgi:hypothetical protein